MSVRELSKNRTSYIAKSTFSNLQNTDHDRKSEFQNEMFFVYLGDRWVKYALNIFYID